MSRSRLQCGETVFPHAGARRWKKKVRKTAAERAAQAVAQDLDEDSSQDGGDVSAFLTGVPEKRSERLAQQSLAPKIIGNVSMNQWCCVCVCLLCCNCAPSLLLLSGVNVLATLLYAVLSSFVCDIARVSST